PTGRVHDLPAAERRDEHAERRDQPEHDDDEDRDPHEPPGPAAASGDGRHRISSCWRNCRTFHTITGMMATNSTTAMAAPRPSLLLMKNHLIMRSAMTSVPLVSAPPITNTRSNTLR